MPETRQQVLVMTTYKKGVRSEAWDWGGEEEDEIFRPYQTPYHALGAGWKLLAPPLKLEDARTGTNYEWWFVRDIEKGSRNA